MSSISFTRIISTYDPLLPPIRSWYETYFPLDERRDFDQLVAMLNIPEMHFCGILTDKTLVGFIVYWTLDNDIYYLEHIGIDYAHRGKHYGNQAMAALLKLPSRFLVLEVEPPHDDSSQRRILFYERQGFSMCSFPYQQPSYTNNGKPVPMKLMSVPELKQESDFTTITQLLKDKIYTRFY